MGITALDITKKPKFGYYFILMAAITAALIHVLSKPMLDNVSDLPEINPIVMAFLIYFICGIFFTPIVKKSKTVSKLTRRDFTFMAAIATAEVSGLITYFYGLSTSTAVNASIFSNSEIIFSLVIAMLVFRERLHIKECIPFSMIVIGMIVIPIGNDLMMSDFAMGSLVTGDLLIIISGLICAVDITLCKYLGDKFDVKKTVQVISFVSAAITISLIAMFEIPMDFDLMQLPGILFMSIIGTGMSTLFFIFSAIYNHDPIGRSRLITVSADSCQPTVTERQSMPARSAILIISRHSSGVLPPRSSRKPACRGWCRSATRWQTNEKACRRFSGSSSGQVSWLAKCRMPSVTHRPSRQSRSRS